MYKYHIIISEFHFFKKMKHDIMKCECQKMDKNILCELGEKHNIIKKQVYEFVQTAKTIPIRLFDVRNYIEKKITNEMHENIAFPVGLNVNSCACHYSPTKHDKTVLKNGDLIKIDFGLERKGNIIDSAFSVEIGTENHLHLIDVVKDAVRTAIYCMKSYNQLSDVGKSIHECVKRSGFYPINELNGHLIEKYKLHAGKIVPSYAIKNLSEKENEIVEGEVYAVEVFVTYDKVKLHQDDCFENISHLKLNTCKSFLQIENELLRLEYLKMLKDFRTLPFNCDRTSVVAQEFMYTFIKNKFVDAYPPLYAKNVNDDTNMIVAHWEETMMVTSFDKQNIVFSNPDFFEKTRDEMFREIERVSKTN